MDLSQREKKAKEHERYLSEWDRNKREFVEEIKVLG
jgi:hypothetical protein